MSPRARRLAWAGVLFLGLAPLAWSPPRATDPPLLRLIGPFAGLGAELQWLRFRGALRRGEDVRALELAASALTLAPVATEGWETLAAHLLYDRASREREPLLARRQALFRAGMSVLTRGVERASHPAELEFFRALVLSGKAESDPELLPGGAPALRAAAREAFARAAALGDPRAGALATQHAPQGEAEDTRE